MSLVHAWFGPHFPLFRHSHPRLGDCLYYVVGGQVVLGSQVLGPGDGFFAPNGLAYKYEAGRKVSRCSNFEPAAETTTAP